MEMNFAFINVVAVLQQTLFMPMHESMHADCQSTKHMFQQNAVTVV